MGKLLTRRPQPSMPALLSHFGINTARFVTDTGEVVFDGVTKVGSGFAHTVHGAVTPVAKHTFHGGMEEPDDDASRVVQGRDPLGGLAMTRRYSAALHGARTSRPLCPMCVRLCGSRCGTPGLDGGSNLRSAPTAFVLALSLLHVGGRYVPEPL